MRVIFTLAHICMRLYTCSLYTASEGECVCDQSTSRATRWPSITTKPQPDLLRLRVLLYHCLSSLCKLRTGRDSQSGSRRQLGRSNLIGGGSGDRGSAEGFIHTVLILQVLAQALYISMRPKKKKKCDLSKYLSLNLTKISIHPSIYPSFLLRSINIQIYWCPKVWDHIKKTGIF